MSSRPVGLRSVSVVGPVVGRMVGLAAGLLGVGCDDETTVIARRPELVLRPDRVDFGTVDITQDRVELLRIQNLEAAPADIASIRLEDDCGGCFLALDAPTEVPSTLAVDLRVRFRAVRLETATATLTVTERFTGQEARAFLVGRGSDARRPDIAVSPPGVNFGLVPAGGVALGSFEIRSVGGLELVVDRITLEPEDAPFRITTSTPTPESPGRLLPGTSAPVTLRAQLPESETSTRTGRILIETNVLEEKNVPGRPGVVAVALTALGNLPPVAVPGEDRVVEPFSTVRLDGSMSFDQDDPPDLPLRYRWQLVDAPGGSRVGLERADLVEAILRPDLAGRFEVDLVVTDGRGLESEPARVVIEAFPDEVVRIELIWDHPDSDLDLHLIREDGVFCDCETSVHYRDCAREADWFPQTPGANPTLDRDDRQGFGPENLNIRGDGPGKFVPAGLYRVAVHYYSTAEQVSEWPTTVSNATVRIYVYGFLAAEVTRAMTAEREVWFVGGLRWPEGVFDPDGMVLSGVQCGTF